MELRQGAERLIETLERVAAGLGAFTGLASQMEYAGHLRRRLSPRIDELRTLVGERGDRSEILRTMAEIKEVMYEVNGAATKGEMQIVSDGLLNTFWGLSTIFQEQRFREEQL